MINSLVRISREALDDNASRDSFINSVVLRKNACSMFAAGTATFHIIHDFFAKLQHKIKEIRRKNVKSVSVETRGDGLLRFCLPHAIMQKERRFILIISPVYDIIS